MRNAACESPSVRARVSEPSEPFDGQTTLTAWELKRTPSHLAGRSSIREGFKPYYEATEIEERVDPNLLYSLKTKLDSAQVYWQQEVTDFAKIFFKPAEKQREADKGMLHKHINPAVERFKGLPEDKKEEFRARLSRAIWLGVIGVARCARTCESRCRSDSRGEKIGRFVGRERYLLRSVWQSLPSGITRV